MKIKAKIKDDRLNVKAKLSSDEEISQREADMLSGITVRGMLRPVSISKNKIEYTGPTGISLTQRMQKPISKYEFFNMMIQIVKVVRHVEDIQLSPINILFNLENVFINEQTRELQFIYAPVVSSNMFADVLGFMEAIIGSSYPTQGQNGEFIPKYFNFLKTLNGYNAERILTYALGEEPSLKKQAQSSSGFMTDKQKDYYDHYNKNANSGGYANTNNGGYAGANNAAYANANNGGYAGMNNAAYANANNGGYAGMNNAAYANANNGGYAGMNNAAYDNVSNAVDSMPGNRTNDVFSNSNNSYGGVFSNVTGAIDNNAAQGDNSDNTGLLFENCASINSGAGSFEAKNSSQIDASGSYDEDNTALLFSNAANPYESRNNEQAEPQESSESAEPESAPDAAYQQVPESNFNAAPDMSYQQPAPQNNFNAAPDMGYQHSAPQNSFNAAPDSGYQQSAPQNNFNAAPDMGYQQTAPQNNFNAAPDSGYQQSAPQNNFNAAPDMGYQQTAPQNNFNAAPDTSYQQSAPQNNFNAAPDTSYQQPAQQGYRQSSGYHPIPDAYDATINPYVNAGVNRNPSYDDDGSGETELLSEGTELLNENASFPVLYRVRTDESVKINKPVFRIGKERSYVDYFVTNNNAVSRSHADIITRGTRYFIIDLNSKNHTYVDDNMLPVKYEIELHDGDRIRLANEEFIFQAR